MKQFQCVWCLQEMQWGLGTITHANTAQSLWRDGIKDYTLCPNRQRRPHAAAASPEDQTGMLMPQLAAQAAAAAVEDEQQFGRDADGSYADPLLLAEDMPTDDGISSLDMSEPAGVPAQPALKMAAAEATKGSGQAASAAADSVATNSRERAEASTADTTATGSRQD
jgi:hypothetical protein